MNISFFIVTYTLPALFIFLNQYSIRLQMIAKSVCVGIFILDDWGIHMHSNHSWHEYFLQSSHNRSSLAHGMEPGSAFIKPDQLDPGIKDQIKINVLPTISQLQLLNFVSCGRACPSHMTQNFGNCRCKIVDSRVFPIWSLIFRRHLQKHLSFYWFGKCENMKMLYLNVCEKLQVKGSEHCILQLKIKSAIYQT